MHQVPKDESYGYQQEMRGSTHVADDDYDQFLRRAAPETGGIRSLVVNLGLSNNGWQATPWPLAEDLHPNAWIVSQARKTLTEAPAGQPLFLTTSFYSPHPPLFPPKRYVRRLPGEEAAGPGARRLGGLAGAVARGRQGRRIGCCWRARHCAPPRPATSA